MQSGYAPNWRPPIAPAMVTRLGSPPKAEMFFYPLKSRDLIERALIDGCVPIGLPAQFWVRQKLEHARLAAHLATPQPAWARAVAGCPPEARRKELPYTPPRNHRRTALRRANRFSVFNDCATETAGKENSTAALNNNPPTAILIALPPLRLLGERLYEKPQGQTRYGIARHHSGYPTSSWLPRPAEGRNCR
jgi:hypothetical protein